MQDYQPFLMSGISFQFHIIDVYKIYISRVRFMYSTADSVIAEAATSTQAVAAVMTPPSVIATTGQ